MAKIPKNVIKAFAVSSTIGAVLKSHQNGEPKLLALQLQINRAMKVFSRKAGPKLYWKISDQIAKIWETIASRHQNTILEEEVPQFTEYLCMLLPPKDFKEFLAVSSYRTSIKIRPEVNARIVESVLLLDEEINKFLGTSAYALTKPKQTITKQKTKRDISKKKIVKSSPTKNQRDERIRHKKAKSFLQQRIEEAKKLKDLNEKSITTSSITKR